MAPVTRHQRSTGARPPPARKARVTRASVRATTGWGQDGQHQQHHYNANGDGDDDDDDDDEDDQDDDDEEEEEEEEEQEEEEDEYDNGEKHHYNGDLVTTSRDPADMDVDQVFRNMAHKVGREVESFSKTLDYFLMSLPTRDKFEATLDLVEQFKNIAKEAEVALRKTHRRERAQQLRKEWSEKAKISTGSSATRSIASESKLGLSFTDKTADQVKRLRQWQQEVDLWDLFRIVLETHYNQDFDTIQQNKEEDLLRMGDVHRYTTEDELWTRFLLVDDLARERFLIKTWLEDTAEHQESDLSSITEELEVKAGQGQGLWSQGCMHTRERIKGEKRLRSWPSTPGAPLPHIKRTDNNELLVTTLDPDASSRQDRTLEKPDAYFDRAMWITCWEMLRRGTSWEEVSEWCQQRKESWRAMSIGMAADPADVSSKSIWRNMCYLASQSNQLGDYEAAVYGLLGGNVNAVQKICRSVDDTIYAYYSAALVQQFDTYLTNNFPERAARRHRSVLQDSLRDPAQQILDLVSKLRKRSTTSMESVKPMKIIQSYLLANDLDSMIHTLGYAIAFADQQAGRPELMIAHLKPFWEGGANQPEEEIFLDPQALRIAAHMAIVVRVLSQPELDDASREAEENVICAYIQRLRTDQQRELIPIYVSRLGGTRQTVSMARVLEDVKDATEQEAIVDLMNKYKLNTLAIVTEQSAYLLDECISPEWRNRRPPSIMETTEEMHLYPGQRIIAGLLPQSTNKLDDSIVRSLQWYQMIDGYWEETFYNLAFAVRKCLIANRLTCAIQIIFEFPYEEVAIRKSFQAIGRSVDLMNYDGPIPIDDVAQWDMLKDQCRTYYELERLVNAIKALLEWRELENEVTKSSALQMSSPSSQLKQAKDAVDDAMVAVLTGNLLQTAISEEEMHDLIFIRTQYIPELVIAYNTVLHTAGSIVGRESLLQSMDLSVSVADDENHLSECFVKTGRMRELVNSFAQTSKIMLVLKSAKSWKPKKEKEGRELGIWEIGPHGSHAKGQIREVSL